MAWAWPLARPYAEMKLVLRARVSAWRRHRAYPNLWPKGAVRGACGARRAEWLLSAMSPRARGILGRPRSTPWARSNPEGETIAPSASEPCRMAVTEYATTKEERRAGQNERTRRQGAMGRQGLHSWQRRSSSAHSEPPISPNFLSRFCSKSGELHMLEYETQTIPFGHHRPPMGTLGALGSLASARRTAAEDRYARGP